MAGDWIAVDTSILSNPKLVRFASGVSRTNVQALGTIFQAWTIADRHGNGPDAEIEMSIPELDALLGVEGAAKAMISVGWLAETATGISFPGYGDRNSSTAKARLVDSRRKRLSRVRETSESTRTNVRAGADKTRTREEKRREEKSKKKTSTSSSASPAARKPDAIWDAVCAVFKIDPQTKTEKGRIGRIVRDLKLKGAEPDDIQIRLDRYRTEWPTAADTPEALLKHWDRFAVAPADRGGDGKPGLDSDERYKELYDSVPPVPKPR